MLAFMAAQSFLMMQMAGAGWQYGKRKISAMKNEEFNALTVNSLLQKEVADVRDAIPTISQSINDMTPMVATIVAQYGDFIKEIINVIPVVVENIYKPDKPPSVDTFNPLTIINPLIPAFADESGILPTPGVSKDATTTNNMIRWQNNIKKETSLRALKLFPLETLGLSTANYSILANAIMKRTAELSAGSRIDKKLPTSTNILPKSRVSKQTLRLQRTKLINDMKRFQAKLHPANARMKTATTRGDRAMISRAKRELDNATKGLRNAKQALANFLDRWKGTKY